VVGHSVFCVLENLLRPANSFRLDLVSILPIFVLVLVASLYWPGMGGTFHFDDARNLQDLAHISDLSSLSEFVFSKTASSIGRPVAYVSFLLNLGDWPDQPRSFLFVNVIIHLTNVFLLACLSKKIGLMAGFSVKQVSVSAWASACLFGVMPILASSTFIVVQRMATLGGTWVLLALWLFVYVRSVGNNKKKTIYFILFGLIPLVSILGVFTKENAALIPVYIYMLDVLLSRVAPDVKRSDIVRNYAKYACIATVFLIAVLFCRTVLSSNSWPVTREFSAWERLITESRVLCFYIKQIVIPRVSDFSPFHDGFVKSVDLFDSFNTWLYCLVILAVLSVAFVSRKKFPLFSFAVLWFFVGHSIESSVLPLELMYEHRNYVPLFGGVLSLSVGLCFVSKLYARGVYILIGVYVLVLSSVLVQVAQVFGDPFTSAELWVEWNPKSERAVQFLALQRGHSGDIGGMGIAVVDGWQRIPDNSGLALAAVQASCQILEEAQQKMLFSEVIASLPNAKYSNAGFESLKSMSILVAQGKCSWFGEKEMGAVVAALKRNPKFQGKDVLAYLYAISGDFYYSLGFFKSAVNDYQESLKNEFRAGVFVNKVICMRAQGGGAAVKDSILMARPILPLDRKNIEQWNLELDQLTKMSN